MSYLFFMTKIQLGLLVGMAISFLQTQSRKRTLSILLAGFLLAAVLPGGAARALSARADAFSVDTRGDYLPTLSTFGVTGEVMEDSHRNIFHRFTHFAEAYDATIQLWLWNTLDGVYSSFDEAKADIAQYAEADAVCILYADDIGQAWVHIGGDIAPRVMEEELTALLLKDEEPYDKLVGVFDTLCAAVGSSTGRYVTGYSMLPGDEARLAVEEALIPLHEAFSGYVFVDYYSGTELEERSVLRHLRDIDYDEVYAAWEHELDYYYRDAIYITYYSETGTAFVDIGEDTGIQLSQQKLERIESAFAPASGADQAGFAAGISALADAAAAPGGAPTVGILLGAAVLMLLIILGVARRKKRT